MEYSAPALVAIRVWVILVNYRPIEAMVGPFGSFSPRFGTCGRRIDTEFTTSSNANGRADHHYEQLRQGLDKSRTKILTLSSGGVQEEDNDLNG